jgi:photosystem II stability/assembly factor-like uncharacterized protein
MSYLRIPSYSVCRRGVLALAIVALIFVSAGLNARGQEPWSTVGPAGGDARSFGAVPGQPNHLYLGTTTGWIYESLDGGASWHHLARIGNAVDLILDHIVVDSQDPATIYAAGWRPDREDGGLWISHDAGRTWKESPGLHGQSVYSFIQSPSDPRTLFAGTLQGVFRSADAGTTWQQISPVGDREIHEVQSLAVDPSDPNVVYAGTWHLPWKTENGGRTWRHIDRGLIVDSDIFSMVIDPDRNRTLYLSACSGIYKSEDAGLLFRKINGIPSSARRTRVLREDPKNHEIVYAGTTEGLYKTENGGQTFHRLTGPDVIVNDVYVDPQNPNHVLLATDRGGVLASENAGRSFSESNTGVSGRKVEALLVDRNDPRRIYAGVVNDKSYGGVFVSQDGGATWTHIGQGLDGLDVFTLAQAQDGTVLAGTSHGIFALPADSGDSGTNDPPGAVAWQPMSTLANTLLQAVTENIHGTRVNVEKQVKDPVTRLDAQVTQLDASGDVWLASSTVGLFTSKNKGATWQGGPVMAASDYLSVAQRGGILVAAQPNGVVESTNGGLAWMPISLPQMVTRIHRVAFSPDGTLWLGTREGVFFTKDLGEHWKWLDRMPFRDVDDLCYDPALKRVLVSSRTSDQIYAIDPKTWTWKWWQTGYDISLIRPAGDRVVAASMDDGVLVQPQAAGMESSRK